MKKYDVVAIVGHHNDKPVWKNCGAVFENEKGLSMKLDLVPIAGANEGWFKFFEPREKGTQKNTEVGSPQPDVIDPDSDIPF